MSGYAEILASNIRLQQLVMLFFLVALAIETNGVAKSHQNHKAGLPSAIQCLTVLSGTVWQKAYPK